MAERPSLHPERRAAPATHQPELLLGRAAPGPRAGDAQLLHHWSALSPGGTSLAPVGPQLTAALQSPRRSLACGESRQPQTDTAVKITAAASDKLCQGITSWRKEAAASLFIYVVSKSALCALQPGLPLPDSPNLTHHKGFLNSSFFLFFSFLISLSLPSGPTEISAIRSHGGGLLTGWGVAGEAPNQHAQPQRGA